LVADILATYPRITGRLPTYPWGAETSSA